MAALLLIAISAGFLLYARYRAKLAIRAIPKRLGINISQQAEGFTYSQSQAGRTLFTIKARTVEQFKQGSNAELHDVTIIVYGREANRYDQIYGADFSYDQQTGVITAHGPVSIDLQSFAGATAKPDQTPPDELNNVIHMKTVGLTFSQKTGIAETSGPVEFRTPRGTGSAVGARYDSHNASVELAHHVTLTTGTAGSEETLTADSANFHQTPSRELIFDHAVLRSTGRETTTPKLRILVRADSSLDHAYAEGGFSSHGTAAATSTKGRSIATSESEASVTAASAELAFSDDKADNNALTSATLRGNVQIEHPAANASAQTAIVHFAPKNVAREIELDGAAQIIQPNGSEIASRNIRLALRPDHTLARVTTPTSAVLTYLSVHDGGTTQLSGDTISADFDDASHIRHLRATPNAKIVSRTPAGDERTTTSAAVDATFTTSGKQSLLDHVVETGSVHLVEGTRNGYADRAEYTAATQRTLLTANARLTDPGVSVTASRISFDQKTNVAVANGDVRVSYEQEKSSDPHSPGTSPGPSLFAGSGPVHIVADSATLVRNLSVVPGNKVNSSDTTATFTGAPVRLWQGTNVLQAPTVRLDRDQRTLTAHSAPGAPVTTSFVEADKSGKLVPVNVTAAALTYSDVARRADFSGGVIARGADGNMTAQRIAVLLLPRDSGQTPPASQGQIDKIIATGQVHLDDSRSGRHGSGDRLVYTAADSKYVLTGTPSARPSIFDAEHGTVTGDSLTFYGHDDKVLVESHGKSTLTETHLPSPK